MSRGYIGILEYDMTFVYVVGNTITLEFYANPSDFKIDIMAGIEVEDE